MPNNIYRNYYKNPETLITVVDNFLKEAQKFKDEINNQGLKIPDKNKGNGVARSYATSAKEFEKFQEFGQDAPKYQYAITIASLANLKGILQPETSEVSLKNSTITAIGDYSETPSNTSFWDKYHMLSDENKKELNNRLLTVLEMQILALEHLKFLVTNDFPLRSGLDSIEFTKRLIESSQITLQEASERLKVSLPENETHLLRNRASSYEAALLYPALMEDKISDFFNTLINQTTALIQAKKYSSYSAHTLFSEKSHTHGAEPILMSYKKTSEEESPTVQNESTPSLSTRP